MAADPLTPDEWPHIARTLTGHRMCSGFENPGGVVVPLSELMDDDR